MRPGQWQRLVCHAVSDGLGLAGQTAAGGAAPDYETPGISPIHTRHRYHSILLAASHDTRSHSQWFHAAHESHCTQRSAPVSTEPQHCNTITSGGFSLRLTVFDVAGGVAVVVGNGVAAFAVCRRFGVGAERNADADEEDTANAVVDAELRPWFSMTVSNCVRSSSSSSCRPPALSRTCFTPRHFLYAIS